ncbi:MAG: methyltransferase domain-containing protein, partial [Planctomycetes bacterium]|nr:methyltransferase domain-containing protein [Planctomycetota bacterium]
MTAADNYAARVDAVLEQRTRLRGPQPPGDLFAGLPDDHPLLRVNPRAPLSENLTVIAEFVGGDDSLLDVGGGAGRYSLPLALRCRDVVNVEGSPAMAAAFERNAGAAGIPNAQAVVGAWPMVETRTADVVLVNHVAYLTRDIRGFVDGLRATARKRVVMTVFIPPPPARNAAIYELVHG